jgi:hypothetical protein
MVGQKKQIKSLHVLHIKPLIPPAWQCAIFYIQRDKELKTDNSRQTTDKGIAFRKIGYFCLYLHYN